MTATALPTATLTTTATSNDNDLQCSRQLWACNTCHISFDNAPDQRQHMKSPWHVYNLKRRIASLPIISLAIFNDQLQPQPDVANKESKRHISKNDAEEDIASPRQCLFCHRRFDNDTDDFENTLEHMATAHGLFLPDHNRITDIESFLGYLATGVREWHECLYCGTTRNSTLAIQSHMRDSAHCKLNLDREPELLDFWEERSEQSLGFVRLSEETRNEVPFSSVIAKPSRLAHQRQAKAARARGARLDLPLVELETTTPPRTFREQSCRQLARRDEMGIQNIGPQQRHALVLAAKRSQKAEETASRASEWSYARKANKQKHDQAHGPLSWAKGGAHNLLPR